MNDPRRQAAEEWARKFADTPGQQADFFDAHLAGQEHTIGRLREYQRALLWCYGWINYALSEGLSPLEFAEYIEDDKWNKVGALVGEASDEVDP